MDLKLDGISGGLNTAQSITRVIGVEAFELETQSRYLLLVLFSDKKSVSSRGVPTSILLDQTAEIRIRTKLNLKWKATWGALNGGVKRVT